MFDLTGNQNSAKDDYQRFYIPDGKVDPDFSAARNTAIIEQSIRDYDATRAKKAKAQDEPFAERAEAVIAYLRSRRVESGSDHSLERYFGRRMLAKLRGDEIREELMAGMNIPHKGNRIIQ